MSKNDATQGNLVPFPYTSQMPSTTLRAVPHYGSVAEPERELSLSDLLHALKSRWLMILAITAGFSAIMLAYCVTRDQLYTASSVIEIRGYAPVLAGATVESLYGADTRKLEYQKTTIAKLKQPGIADRVLSSDADAQLVAHYFGLPLNTAASTTSRGQGLQQLPKLVASYLGLIDINPISETSLVEIQAITREPRLSMIVANAHAEGFIEALRLERQESMRTNLKALETQANELKGKLATAEQEIADYSEQTHLIVPSGNDAGKDLTLQKIVGITELLSHATGKRVQSENLYNQLKNSPLANSSSLDNDSIQQWRFELNKLEGEYTALGQKVTAAYPDMVDLKSRINSLSRSIADERGQLLKALASRLDNERAAEQQLVEQVAKEESQAHENLRKMARFTVLRKEADSLRELYEAVLKQLQETTVSAASGVSNIFISDWATEPQTPSYPKTNLLVILATLIGLGLGVLCAWTMEYFDNRIKNSNEAATALDLPLLGVLPSFAPTQNRLSLDRLRIPYFNKQSDGSALATISQQPIAISQPDAMVSEALRTIRAGLLLSSVDSPLRTIMVTSAEKGEGKTTIAANLAVSLAQAEYRVLLIDADLRETSLGNLFPQLLERKGLSDLIAGQTDFAASVVKEVIPFLDILGRGSRPPNPAEIVGSKKMRETIASLRDVYDFIIIDSPPVLPVADSLMLSSAVDAVLMVTRAGKTLRRNAREARRRLQRVRANIAGVIVNGSDPRHETIYGEQGNRSYFTVMTGTEVEVEAKKSASV